MVCTTFTYTRSIKKNQETTSRDAMHNMSRQLLGPVFALKVCPPNGMMKAGVSRETGAKGHETGYEKLRCLYIQKKKTARPPRRVKRARGMNCTFSAFFSARACRANDVPCFSCIFVQTEENRDVTRPRLPGECTDSESCMIRGTACLEPRTFLGYICYDCLHSRAKATIQKTRRNAGDGQQQWYRISSLISSIDKSFSEKSNLLYVSILLTSAAVINTYIPASWATRPFLSSASRIQ